MKPLLSRLLLAAILLPACATTDQRAQAQARTDLGTAYLREGNAPAALEVLSEAVRKDPRNWEAWERLGLAYWAQGDLEQSERAFVKSVKLVPEKAEVNNNFGLLLMSQGRNAEAIERFQAARKDLQYRRPALVLNNLGHALYQEGRYEEALQVLDQAIQRSPQLCNAHFHRALVFEGLGRLDGALSSFEQAIALCGETAPGAYYHAGLLLAGRGDLDAACNYFSTVREQSSPGSELHEAASKARAERCP